MKAKAIAGIAILLIAISISLCGCSLIIADLLSEIGNNEKNVNSENNSLSFNTVEPPQTDLNIKTIGDITTVDEFECMIKEVNWYSASDFEYDCIDLVEGFEYIVIVLSEKNTTDDTKNAPTANQLSADGLVCTNKLALSLYKKQYKIMFGATLAGSTAEAYVIYQIPVGAQSFKFQIFSEGFGKNSEYIVFERDDIQ